MNSSPEDVARIAAKIDSLGMWEQFSRYNWAIKPKGIAVPYFCTAFKIVQPDPVKWRYLILEGWQTLHDFIRFRMDDSFGYYSTPMEMSHYELVVFNDKNVSPKVFRHDPGYIPREVTDAVDCRIAAKLLWQTYGMMLRMESEPHFALKFSSDKAVFARIEREEGTWEDAPLVIPDPSPFKETVAFPKDLLDKVKDLPMNHDAEMTVDFTIASGIMTKEERPRTVYLLQIKDSLSGKMHEERASVSHDGGLKSLWQEIPVRVLSRMVADGFVPGGIRVTSKRLFRLLRSLLIHLPVKLRLNVEGEG